MRMEKKIKMERKTYKDRKTKWHRMDLNMSWEWCTAVCIMCVHSPRYRSNLPLSCAVLDNGKLDNFFSTKEKDSSKFYLQCHFWLCLSKHSQFVKRDQDEVVTRQRINPDWPLISPYIIPTESNIEVIRIKEMIIN